MVCWLSRHLSVSPPFSREHVRFSGSSSSDVQVEGNVMLSADTIRYQCFISCCIYHLYIRKEVVLFPAKRKHHKFSGLNLHNLFSSIGQKSEKAWAKLCSSLEALIQLLDAICTPWTVRPFFHSKSIITGCL
jgi:hypothetical protein